ncbi:MAG: type II toxin-antitoxin system Phd/YefM family antitoxin [Calditrichaeota bacterium]|nr:MAG: type II toxin-antitoxin system Phd/YefM family antitoxin [Calditrichota bacterium]
MQRLKIKFDQKTISEFKDDVLWFIEHVKKSKNPILLTQNGEKAAILMDIESFIALMDEIELLRDIEEGLEDYSNGNFLNHQEAKKQITQ